jgi:rubredoxin
MTQNKEGICKECGKDYSEIKTVCGHCGYSPHGAIVMTDGDPHWKCGACGRIVQAASPPKKCPLCGEVCDFKNVTCYTPECGGPGNIDPQL